MQEVNRVNRVGAKEEAITAGNLHPSPGHPGLPHCGHLRRSSLQHPHRKCGPTLPRRNTKERGCRVIFRRSLLCISLYIICKGSSAQKARLKTEKKL